MSSLPGLSFCFGVPAGPPQKDFVGVLGVDGFGVVWLVCLVGFGLGPAGLVGVVLGSGLVLVRFRLGFVWVSVLVWLGFGRALAGY